jgi:hypothetical protein
LASERQPDREAVVRRAVEARKTTIAAAISVVKQFAQNELRKGTTRDAMGLLGEYRAVEAVPVLVENLGLYVFYKESKRPQLPEDQYPAGGALIRIGVPALAPVTAKVMETDDENVLRLAGVVIRGVLGDELGSEFIRLRRSKEPDGNRRKRLDALEAQLKALRATYGAAAPGTAQTR